MIEPTSIEWWKKQLEELGFKCQLEYTDGVHYTGYGWFFSMHKEGTYEDEKKLFDTTVFSVYNGLPLNPGAADSELASEIEERFYFDDDEMDLPTTIRVLEEIMLVLKAIKDPSEAPLLAGMSWAGDIMADLLKEGEHGCKET